MQYRNTPLMYATKQEKGLPIVELLVENNADVNAKDEAFLYEGL